MWNLYIHGRVRCCFGNVSSTLNVLKLAFDCVLCCQLYAAYNIHVILGEGPVSKNALSFTWFTLQILFEVQSFDFLVNFLSLTVVRSRYP